MLLLAGFFDGISDNWLHGFVLGGAAVLVWWEARRERRAPIGQAVATTPVPASATVDPRRSGRAPQLVVAGLGYAVLVGGWQRYTLPTTIAVVLAAVAVFVVGWRAPQRANGGAQPGGSMSARPWAVLAVAGGLWELFALMGQPSLTEGSYDHPTVSYLMDTVLASHLGRTVTLTAWLAFGWYLLSAEWRARVTDVEIAPPVRSEDLDDLA